MPTISLTKKNVEALPRPTKGQVLYRDSQLTGFGLRVGTSSKVWIVEGQVARRTRRVTIGRADIIHPDVARKKAMSVLSDMINGIDPNQAKRDLRADHVTLLDAFTAFFEAKPNLSRSTIDAYRRTQNLYLARWQTKHLQKITRQMVLAEHRKITADRGEATANSVFRHFRSIYNFTVANFDTFAPNPALVLGQARAWHKERRRKRLISISQLP